ncbi:MAG: glycosyltransferase [Tannerellaceae bacterium]|nr:glycosyltransferase [Tannerellaceae bacterium]
MEFPVIRKQTEVIPVEKEKNLTDREKYILRLYQREHALVNNSNIDKIIAISQHSYKDLTELFGVSPQRVSLIRNALPDRYKKISSSGKKILKEKYHLSPDTKVVVFAGRLDAVKGVVYLVKAFRIVLQSNPDVHLFIAGSGSWDTYTGLSYPAYSKVSFTGYLPQQKLYELYHLADIGVVPSLHEEFGLVTLEMMMHKLPVVTNCTTGFPETVIPEKTGLYTTHNIAAMKEEEAVRDLADKIIRLLNAGELRRQMGENGRKYFLKQFTTRTYQKQMLAFYEGLSGFSEE